MRICGIELKSSEAIMAIIDIQGSRVVFDDIEPKKIKLGNDEEVPAVKAFLNSIIDVIRTHEIDLIVIKKRAKKGQMAGGAISFKMETIIQLNGTVDVVFVTGQGIAAANKKDSFNLPEGIKKYQETAFMAASLYLRQNISGEL